MAAHRTARQTKGIFCIEGDWWGSPHKPATVKPMLELLNVAEGYRVPYQHKDVDTRESLGNYVNKWVQSSHSNYPILYLALHGNEGCITVGDERLSDSAVSIEDFARFLEGRCTNRVIYFGSCKTLQLHGNTIKTLLRKTGALAVIGYTKGVDWMESTAYDLMVLAEAQKHAFTAAGLRSMKARLNDSASCKLGKSLGFRIETK